MIPGFFHLFIEDHLEDIRILISEYIEAEAVIVPSRHHLDNRLARARWGDPSQKDRIFMCRTISIAEQMCILNDLGAAAESDPSYPQGISRCLPTSFHLLALVVLHEIAHIKHGWDKVNDKACTLWALAQIAQRPSWPGRP